LFEFEYILATVLCYHPNVEILGDCKVYELDKLVDFAEYQANGKIELILI